VRSVLTAEFPINILVNLPIADILNAIEPRDTNSTRMQLQ